MQISNTSLPQINTPKAQAPKPTVTPAKPFPGQEAFYQRLQDIQQNRDLRAALAEQLSSSKGIVA